MNDFFDVDMRFNNVQFSAIKKAAAIRERTVEEYIRSVLLGEDDEGRTFKKLTIFRAFFRANRIRLHSITRVVKLKPRKHDRPLQSRAIAT